MRDMSVKLANNLDAGPKVNKNCRFLSKAFIMKLTTDMFPLTLYMCFGIYLLLDQGVSSSVN